MMPLTIDFAKRRTGPAAAGLVLLIAAALLMSLAGSALWRAYRQNDRARAELAAEFVLRFLLGDYRCVSGIGGAHAGTFSRPASATRM
jgi:hypothetical protein